MLYGFFYIYNCQRRDCNTLECHDTIRKLSNFVKIYGKIDYVSKNRKDCIE